MMRQWSAIGALPVVAGAMFVLLACSLVPWTSSAQAAQTNEDKCTSKRADAAGKYQRCVRKWQSRCYRGVCVQETLSKCRENFAAVWPKLQKVTGSSCDAERWEDNGDGTVTDNLTGLVWEKKTDDNTEHDQDNLYTWSAGAPYIENGTMFTAFLSSLNAGGGFAGANGWRVPTFEELQTILLPEPYPCSTHPCIDPLFGPTQSSLFWSATTGAGGPIGVLDSAFFVDFNDGAVWGAPKTPYVNYVRAVRGGL